MKSIYLVLILASLIVIAMLGLSFFYLDRQRHQIFLYALYYDDTLAGYEKVDRYILENRVIYKSITELARDILRRETVRKLTFDIRGKNFISYNQEITADGAKSAIYISNNQGDISFLGSGHANFAYLDKVPIYGNDTPFEDTSVATYPALIRRYNFKKRGEQFVNVLSPTATSLPPLRNIISITSVGKDIIEIEGREINAERLIAESKGEGLISIWVTGTFHNILMIHIPKDGFKAVLCAEKKVIPVKEYKRKGDLYIEKEVSFANEDIMLYGTLSVPVSGEVPYPAVMLIWDSGSLNRNALGIFTDIAHTLAKAGYCVLRFDKRGIGQSEGFFTTYAQPEEISDLKYALNFLKSQPQVDKSRIALLGHSEGGFYATYLAELDGDVRACIVLSAISSFNPLKNDCKKLKDYVKKIVPDDEEYLESAVKAIKQSREIIKDKGDWITIQNRKVFTKKMDLEDKYSPLETIKKTKVPVLILHGRGDDINLFEEAEELGSALAEVGNENFTIIFFGELDHFLGTVVKEPPTRDHIEVDDEVLGSITSWLDKNLLPPLVEPISSVGELLEEKSSAAEPVQNIEEH